MKKIVLLSSTTLIFSLLAIAFVSTPANAATGECKDYAPDQTSVLLCNLGLKPKPIIPDNPGTIIGECKDYAPDQTSILLCNLGLKPKPTIPAPTDPQPDACGEVVIKDDGTQWECTFNDDFEGDSLDRTKWVPQTNFATGEGNYVSCMVDDERVVSVSDGSLKLSVKDLGEPVACPSGVSSNYGSGQVSTFYKFSQQYGRFEARMKNTATDQPGLQEAFWLWPDVRYSSTATWPFSGEIDIVETYSYYNNLAIPFFHYSADVGGPQPGVNTAWHCVAERGVWNTYTLEWDANNLKVFVNGDLCLHNTSGDPAFNKRYIVALTQAFGVTGNNHTGTAPLPATTEVDYVKVWK